MIWKSLSAQSAHACYSSSISYTVDLSYSSEESCSQTYVPMLRFSSFDHERTLLDIAIYHLSSTIRPFFRFLSMAKRSFCSALKESPPTLTSVSMHTSTCIHKKPSFRYLGTFLHSCLPVFRIRNQGYVVLDCMDCPTYCMYNATTIGMT